MKFRTTARQLSLPMALITCGFAMKLSGETRRVNCDLGVSLQRVIDRTDPGDTILLTGTCLGPITISRKGITIRGQDNGAIDGQKSDAVTIYGAPNIRLEALDIRNGKNGVVGQGGAHVALLNDTVHDNSSIGILLESNSVENHSVEPATWGVRATW
jgi:nitrous oxidase accessory protein NosD